MAAIRPAKPIRPTQVAGFVLGLIGCIIIFAPGNSGTIDPLGTF